MYHQTRLVNPDESRQNINELIRGGDLISNSSENLEFQFTSSIAPDGRHPNFQADYASGSLENKLASYSVNLMTANNDPRLPFYFYKQSSCVLTGANGGEPSNPGDDNVRALHGIYPIGGKFDDNSCLVHNQTQGLQGAGIFPMITNTMRLFIEAEAALILGTDGDPATLLEMAINESFNHVASFSGVPFQADDVTNYVTSRIEAFNNAADQEAKLKVMMLEKYVAMFGNGIESYNDLRRTGYPDNLNPPIVQNGPFPNHLPIPPREVTANENIDADGDLTTRVFWDID